jgi:hypothetical protein
LAAGERIYRQPLPVPYGRSGSLGDVGDITPGPEGTVTGGSMIGGSQEVATELEQVVDLAVAGEELLRMPRRLEALHLPFPVSLGSRPFPDPVPQNPNQPCRDMIDRLAEPSHRGLPK